jgi:FMN phosphatase YigB (HAD superfamily)
MRTDQLNLELPNGLETIFLDAGNTLISMDYAWIQRELAGRGHVVSIAALVSAEAAARPATSRHVAEMAEQSGLDAYLFYLSQILANLLGVRDLSDTVLDALCRSVAAALKRPGSDHRLWSKVLPGVPDALSIMRRIGLKLIVVSNSDGSVERALKNLGLADQFAAVLDSQIVGFEKPDPLFFEHALTVAGADPDKTLHVGDMYFQDVLGARAAGIECVLLDPDDNWGGADCVRRRDLLELARELEAAQVQPGFKRGD